MVQRLKAENMDFLINVDKDSDIYACAGCYTYWVNVSHCWCCGKPGLRLDLPQ